MGELAAANATTDAIVRWNPNYVLMVGIAAGIPNLKEDRELGDVIVADQVIGYEHVKVTDKGYEYREHEYPASALLLDRVRNFWDASWMNQIAVPRPANAKRPGTKLHVGPVASGDKVVASTGFRDQLTARWPKLVAVEMEAEGVFSAVFDRPQIRNTLMIRGISDLADERKSDEWQEYAANAAAAFAISFLKSGPVEPLSPPALHTSPSLSQAWEREGDRRKERVQVSLAKLPSTSPDLFGREKELALLDAAWASPLLSATRTGEGQGGGKINVLMLVAWGGVGKSALVNQWLARMARQNYCGAERVYGWSFYSQGAAEGRQVSADPFVAAALKWFGDPDPSAGSPWDKGERLAELVKRQCTLLILDGLEPLQNPPPVETGCIKDPGLKALLRELARQNPGLVVITTRLAVDDLKDSLPPLSTEGTARKRGWGGGAFQLDLENLSTEAGAAYLAHLGVKGTDEELARAADEFGGHALALTLLGKYLATVHRGDVRKRDQIARLTDERRQGAHARRVMAAYESWFKGKPELDILRLMGLFDRPAEGGALDALRKEPAIPSLTTNLQSLSHADWQYAVESLRTARLIAAPDPHDPEALDCHPLLREHFAQKLRAGDHAAWREAHSRLYEYYKSCAKQYPDTIEEMAPLYAAVMHGCQAGRHQVALDEVYWERIQREDEAFNVKKLGAFGAELAVLSGFFDPPWRKVVDGLREDAKSFVLNEVGYDLQALSRLADASQPMQAGLKIRLARKEWKNAAKFASNLSELYLTLGNVQHALDAARQSVELADRSDDAFERMSDRAILADALHQAGQLAEAEAAFRKAEEIQRNVQLWSSPILVSVWGFKYCDFLLGKEACQDVQNRANQSLAIAETINSDLLSIALDHLSLGRVHLLQAQVVEAHRDAPQRDASLRDAATYLDRAVDGLRQAGQQDDLPRGLLARTELRRVMGQLDKAQRDLDEAFSIATRGGMRLHEADCHLAYARLYLARGEKDEARKSLAKAKHIIEQTGYHRRDKEVAELEGQL
jgi:nucleoside phosphorylase/tetratricopeptide (TPR) repeat protein